MSIFETPHYRYLASLSEKNFASTSQDSYNFDDFFHDGDIEGKLRKLRYLQSELSRGAKFEIVVMWKPSFQKLIVVDGFHRLASLAATKGKNGTVICRLMV